MTTMGGLKAGVEGGELEDERLRGMMKELQSRNQQLMREVLRTLCLACRSANPCAQANRAALVKAGGVSQLVDMLVDETTTIGQLGPKGVDKHSFTEHVVRILRDLAEKGADDDDASAVHAQMIFVGLPAWLAEYLQAAVEAKHAGRMPKPQPIWSAVWSGNSRAANQFETAAMAQQLVLMLAASASGIEGLLHAGLAKVLAEEIRAAPSELTRAVVAAATMVLKYHHECTGAVEAARVASVGGQGYSQLVEAAGTAVQNEVAALVEDIKGCQDEDNYTAAAEELVRLSLFSNVFVETVAMKLLPALNGMIQSDHAELVSRASKVVAVVSEDSPDMATVLCSSGLLPVVVCSLTPVRQFQNAAVSHHSAQDAYVSPKTRLYLLEIMSTISLPTASESPHSILLRSVSSWPVVYLDSEEQAHRTSARSSLSGLLDDFTTAFRVEAERRQVALGPLTHFVTVISFMVLDPKIRELIAERSDLVELLLAHSCINTLGVLAVVAVLDSEANGDNCEGALWALRRIPSLGCPIVEDASVSFQVAAGLGFLVAQPEFAAYVLGMDLVPILLSFLEEQNGSDFAATRRQSVRVLEHMLQDASLHWEHELAGLRDEVQKAVASFALVAETDVQSESSQKEGLANKLPDGWEERESATTGEVYFFNVKTGESQWEVPTDTCAIQEQQHEDAVDVTDARDVSTEDETEDESDEGEFPDQMGNQLTEREAGASTLASQRSCTPGTELVDFRTADAIVGGQAQQHAHRDLKESQNMAGAKRDEQAAENEKARLKEDIAQLRREWQVQQAAEAEVAKVMATEIATAKQAQQVAERDVNRLNEELTAAQQAQKAAALEASRLTDELTTTRQAQQAAELEASRLCDALATTKQVQQVAEADRPAAPADERAAVVPLHKYQQLLQLVASLEARISGLETSSMPDLAASEKINSVEPQHDGMGMSLSEFLTRYRLESYETGLQGLGVVVPQHLCDVDDNDLESMGMKRLEVVRFRTACDLLESLELDDL